MGATRMGLDEGELKGIVDAWKSQSQYCEVLYEVEDAAIRAVKGGLLLACSIILSFTKADAFYPIAPARNLVYVKPRIEMDHRFNGRSLPMKVWSRPPRAGDGLIPMEVGWWRTLCRPQPKDCLAEALLET